MDLTFSDEQQAMRDLTRQILGDKLPPERLRQLEGGDAPEAARDTWRALAAADLLGLGLPEAFGGGGYGFAEVCLLLEEVGLAVAPLPAYATLVLGALPIARFGTDAQREAWLPGVIAGEVVLSAALAEPGDDLPLATPATVADAAGDGFVLRGEKRFVPDAASAARVLVPATLADGSVAVFLVDPSADGVRLEALATISGLPSFVVHLDGVTVTADDRLGGPSVNGDEVVEWLLPRALAATCVTQSGVCEMALRTTARYVSEREQFNVKLATFQGVSQRAADAYIDTELVRLTAWQAVWRLSDGRDATEAVSIAKFFAAEAAHRVVHAAQHLHGGIGLDLDYPVHRSFRWAKELEARLGGGTRHLLQLGASLAATS